MPLHPNSLAEHQRDPSVQQCTSVGKLKRDERRSGEPQPQRSAQASRFRRRGPPSEADEEAAEDEDDYEDSDE